MEDIQVNVSQEGVTIPRARKKISDKWIPYLVMAPGLLITIGVLYPFVLAIYDSLTDLSFNSPTVAFVGLQNYVDKFRSPSFFHSIYVTAAYAVITTALELIVGVAMALILHRMTWTAHLFQSLFILPLMVSTAIATLLWRLMTNPTYGIYTRFLDIFGIHHFPWANSPRTALLTVVLVDAWVYIPFVILIVLAGLKSLPPAPFEAARIDGGSFWFTFRRLTLPLLRPILIIVTLFRLMDGLQQFTIIYAMTAGGPGDALMNIPNLAYEHGFLYLTFGPSLAYLVLLWVLVFIVSRLLVAYWNRIRMQEAEGE